MSDPLLDILIQAVPEDKLSISSYDFQGYLEHLRRLPQDSIASEKEHLETSSKSIKTTLVSLTKKSQQQFIASARAVSELGNAFDKFQQTVDSLNEKVPNVEHEIHHVKQLKAEPDNNGTIVLLRNLDKIQDILELPSLTLACVRNGLYSEALDLASHCRRLGIRYKNINIIQQIQLETEKVMKTMLLQLVKLLRETTKLPTLIKIVSYLRRMQPFQSAPHATRQLQQLFLVSRLAYIRSQWSILAPLKQTPEKYVKRYLEVYREHVFATVGGFDTIFPVDDQSSSTRIEANSSRADIQVKEQLMAEFLRATVQELRQTMDQVSPLITDKSARSSLWLQMAYCSQSLGRVGAEFWPTIQGDQTAGTNEEWAEAIQKQRDISRDISQRLGRDVVA
jgi:hypothetical protein